MPIPPDATLILPLDLPPLKNDAPVVRVRGRFLRSVHLERDFYTPGATEGYVPTPAARSALFRILPGADNKPAARAFSITGPYGSGKSAFALTLAKALAAAPMGDADLRREAESVLGHPLFGGETESGLWPVLIVGGRQPLGDALLDGLARSWERLPVAGVVLPELPALGTGAEVARFYEAASAILRESVPGVRGILVVIDEAGKFLEFAAQTPEAGDIQVLQELAEACVRSAPDAPLMVVTILHQSFDDYAQRSGGGQATRNEWRKVQGRFNDLAFADAPEEMLRLVARAMERTPDAARDAGIVARAQAASRRAHELRLLPRPLGQEEFAQLCASAFPLHPLTLLALPHVFRRFGQGERSLFGFLSGDEPGGLNDFLATMGTGAATDEPIYYRLDRLYDYLLLNVGAAALIGGGAGHSATARLWSETQEAVERSGEQEALPPLAAGVAKIIGLLHVLGDSVTHLPASTDVLKFALDDVSPTQVDSALAGLTRATLITYRRYKNAFRPYEGSDLDVEERLRDVLGRMNQGDVDVSATAAKLAHLAASGGGEESDSAPLLLPLVARRHLFETGTLRVFEVVLRRAGDPLLAFPPVPRTGDAPFDGTVLLVLTPNDGQADAVGVRLGRLFAARPDYLVGVVRETTALQETARTLESLLLLQSETPELARDRVAAREVRERIAEAEGAFREEWDGLLAGANAAAFVTWWWRGETVEARTARDRQKLVSDACQAAYPSTPRLLNELVNRRALASAAASARRTLFEAMIERGDEETLGMEGFPPERSMYAALLRETGIHRFDEERGVWTFGPPTPDRDPPLGRVWEAIEAFLFGMDNTEADDADETTETEEDAPQPSTNIVAKPLPRLWETLRCAPFGLGEGVIPVLLCAAFLHHASEVVLYEDGAFVIGLDAATFERLAKRPEMFSVQGVRITGERARVLERLGENLLKSGETQTVGNIVRGLFRRVARLPAWALRTGDITPDAVRVRALLKEAREPERLLFDELPRAVGAAPLGDQAGNDANIARFFAGLNDALQSWFGAYPALLASLQTQTCRAFGVEDVAELRARFAAVHSEVREPRLLAFVNHTLAPEAETGGSAKWIEPVASVVMSRPPAGWTDADAARYEDALSPLVTALQSAELVAFARAKEKGLEETVGVRFAVAEEGGIEEARIIFTPKNAEDQIEEYARQILNLLDSIAADKSADLRLAALSRAAQTVLRRSGK